MKLSALASKYGEFYAPAFSVHLGQLDLLREHRVAISQIEVDLQLGTASHFSFTVTDCYDFKNHAFSTGRGRDVIELLDFGTELSIFMGYGDRKSMVEMMSGVVTEMATSFPETGAPELTIGGYDHGFPLTLGKNSRTWAKERDSAAVHEIAAYNNLNASIEKTEEEHEQIEQNQISDWEFMKKLADRNHYEIYVDEKKTLRFRKPNDKGPAEVDLNWGEGLLSFKPEANLAGQVGKVEVYGWDRSRKESIIGVAVAGVESGLKGKSGGQRLSTFIRDPKKLPTLRLRQPVFTQSEANERARAALNERAKKFLTGEAEAIGLPELRPDRNVRLDKLGHPFSKTYYIQQATHRIDQSGYRTRFKVKETGL
jgi:uncharacterized protein